MLKRIQVIYFSVVIKFDRNQGFTVEYAQMTPFFCKFSKNDLIIFFLNFTPISSFFVIVNFILLNQFRSKNHFYKLRYFDSVVIEREKRE